MKATVVLSAILYLCFCIQVFGQFNTPTIDGVISPGEYGVHVDGQNQKNTGSGQTWYMTWDNTNLYVAVTNANLSEGAVIYIDHNPLAVPNAGTNSDGTIAAINYDNTQIANLPFRADFRAYFKDGYRDYRKADGANGWTAPVSSGVGSYASSASGSVREFAIPWALITGSGRPSSFLFLCYLSSSSGFIYGQVPQGNGGGNFNGNYNRYYAVVNTNNGVATKPFSYDRSVVGDNNIQYLGLRHDTFDSYYRSPFGAVTTGSTVNLKFRTDVEDVQAVYLKVYKYNPATDTTDSPVEYPMSFLERITQGATTYDVYSINYVTPTTPAIIYYKFRVVDGSSQAFYSDAYLNDHDNLGQGGDGTASATEPFPAFQLTVYDSNFTTPSWIRDAIVYQIFPDRFRNGDITNDWCRSGSTTGCPSLYGAPPSSNYIYTTWNTKICDPRDSSLPCYNNYGSQFYGGDLKGIEDKLDYIKNMGFNTIYLNPIFKARSYHRYDTDDYLNIADELGGNPAFQSLMTAANAKGIRIILDGVFNHMSQDSEYFDYFHRSPVVGACESLSSPYRGWFNFYNNNVPCSFTDYEGWFGFGGLPVFKEVDPVKDFFYRTPNTNVTQYWYNQGISGWRFDVATDISHQWWNEYRTYAKTYKADGVLIGEVFPDASSYLAGDQLDGVMNYRFRKNLIGFARGVDWEDNDNNGQNKIVGLTPSQFDRAMKAIREDYPLPAQYAMLNLIDSHDTNRALYVLTLLGDTGLTQAKERLKLAAIFQFTYIGAPMVYYGDEAGINAPSQANNSNGFPEDDPYNRAPYPWPDEAGNQNIYGPVDSNLINFYTLLANFRKSHPALRIGSFDTLLMGDLTPSSTDNNTYAFARAAGADKVIVALNNGTSTNTVSIPVAAYFSDGTVLKDAITGTTYTVTSGTVSLSLQARSGVILSQLSPTAATASIAGRVVNSYGRPVSKALVVITDEQGNQQSTLTNWRGAFIFEEVEVGKTYIVSVSHKRYEFNPSSRVLFVTEDIRDADFQAIR